MKVWLKYIALISLLIVSYDSYSKDLGLSFENSEVYIELRKDINGFKAITDKKTGRNYASGLDSYIYKLKFGNNYKDSIEVTSAMASKRKIVRLKDGIELHYWHEGEIPLNVVCNVSFEKGSSLMKWSIKVNNDSKKTLCLIEYPRISCRTVLETDASDDAVVFPLLEGSLFPGIKEGVTIKGSYPGHLSAQLMYYFDPQGGFYYAAHDGEGFQKTLSVSNSKGSLVFSHEYLLPIEYRKEIELPYSVVTGFSGGRWEEGAIIYREWAQEQKWCASTLSTKDTPEWLKKPNLFTLVNYTSPDFKSVEKADSILKKYHDFYDVSVITTGWGWEKNGMWIGPDYFPPVNGDNYYSDLTAKVNERGDHLHLYISGFRWGVKKPMTEKKGETRFTSFDGMDLFMKQGKSSTVVDFKGELLLSKLPWAYNYILCPGSEHARAILDSCFTRVYKWGVSGIDLDQNVGGHVDECFSPDHGHPIGAGLWQYKAMKDFLAGMRKNAKLISKDNFTGLEEPCEIFIPQIDVVNSRNFCLTGWPVCSGAVSVPLYNFLYHQYQIFYPGWIPGRAPFGITKNAIGRAFIFGMYPGIRINGEFDLQNGKVTDESKMLKGYIQLMKKYPEFLLRGKMIGEISVMGCDSTDIVGAKGEVYPIKWKTVQGIAWQSEYRNETAYTLVNLSDKSQEVRIKLNKTYKEALVFTGYELDQEVKQNIIPENSEWVMMKLAPWQLSLIKLPSRE